MTATTLSAVAAVSVGRDTIQVRDLAIRNAEAAALIKTYLEQGGAEAAADALRRAIPVGLVALTMTSASIDSASIQRTLDGFAQDLDAKSRRALAGLDEVLARLHEDEQAVGRVAQRALEQLPSQLDRVLGGEAANVRQAVTAAAQQVQATSLDELRRALDMHAQAVRQALSLDREGPVQTLRRDLLAQLDGTRRELSEQLAVIRELVRVAEASKTASAKSTRSIGAAFEAEAIDLAQRIAVAAGDRFEPTGAHPAPGTTSRAGDGVSTLMSAITGRKPVRIVVEAKLRTRPLSAKAWREALAEARTVRDAAGALALVPSAEQVPGPGAFARVDELSFVVAADAEHAELVYLVLRELVALVAVRQNDGEEIDLAKIDAQMNSALKALEEFDEVGRLAKAATKNLAGIMDVGGRVRKRIEEALTAGLAELQQ
jgi:hypothetical protein